MMEIEFNWIMQELYEIKKSNAKSQGFAGSFFSLSMSAVFYTLILTTDDNTSFFSIFANYFLIAGFISLIITHYRVKAIGQKFYTIMKGYEKLKK